MTFRTLRLVVLLAALLAPMSALAAHPFLCCDHNAGKICVVSTEGKIEWEYPCKAAQDCWKLPSGNFLFCGVSGATEVTPEKKIVWEYKAPANAEVHACQPIDDGRVLVLECGTSRLVEVDRAGKVAKEIKLVTAPSVTTHNQFRGARKTKAGHYWVCFKGEGKVVELDGDGKVLRSIKVPGDPHEVVPLPNDHLLVSCGDGHQVIEFDLTDKAKEKIVWQLNENDLPGNPLRLMAGCQRLPNGNTILCNYLGHGHLGKQPHVVEVTPDKKVVWQFEDHKQFQTINQIFALDIPGEALR